MFYEMDEDMRVQFCNSIIASTGKDASVMENKLPGIMELIQSQYNFAVAFLESINKPYPGADYSHLR